MLARSLPPVRTQLTLVPEDSCAPPLPRSAKVVSTSSILCWAASASASAAVIEAAAAGSAKVVSTFRAASASANAAVIEAAAAAAATVSCSLLIRERSAASEALGVGATC